MGDDDGASNKCHFSSGHILQRLQPTHAKRSITGLYCRTVLQASMSNQGSKEQKNITTDGQIQVEMIEMESGIPKPGVTITEANVVSMSCLYCFSWNS